MSFSPLLNGMKQNIDLIKVCMFFSTLYLLSHMFDMGSSVELAAAVMAVVLMMKGVEGSQATLKDITSGFFKVLNDCKHELNLPDHIIADFYHYWKQDYALLNRDTGCAIICMSKKLDLIDDSGKLHHGNAQEFAAKHGADDSMASKLVQILHECEKQYDSMEDDCSRVLEVAKCFRTTIHELGWAPTIDVIIEEVLSEI